MGAGLAAAGVYGLIVGCTFQYAGKWGWIPLLAIPLLVMLGTAGT